MLWFKATHTSPLRVSTKEVWYHGALKEVTSQRSWLRVQPLFREEVAYSSGVSQLESGLQATGNLWKGINCSNIAALGGLRICGCCIFFFFKKYSAFPLKKKLTNKVNVRLKCQSYFSAWYIGALLSDTTVSLSCPLPRPLALKRLSKLCYYIKSIYHRFLSLRLIGFLKEVAEKIKSGIVCTSTERLCLNSQSYISFFLLIPLKICII